MRKEELKDMLIYVDYEIFHGNLERSERASIERDTEEEESLQKCSDDSTYEYQDDGLKDKWQKDDTVGTTHQSHDVDLLTACQQSELDSKEDDDKHQEVKRCHEHKDQSLADRYCLSDRLQAFFLCIEIFSIASLI